VVLRYELLESPGIATTKLIDSKTLRDVIRGLALKGF
jgi:hypothetical protein